MFGFEFANPKYFLLLVLLIPMILWYVFREKKSHADLQFSSLQAFKGIKHAGRIWLRHVLFALEVLAIVFLVFAMEYLPVEVNLFITITLYSDESALKMHIICFG